MKILFLSDGLYPFSVGGMQKHSSTLISFLANKGHHVICVFPGDSVHKADEVKSHFKGHPNLDLVSVEYPRVVKLPGHYVRANKGYSKNILNWALPDIKTFDIVYAQGFTGFAFLRNRNKIGSLPIVVNLHGYGEFFEAPNFLTKLKYRMLQPIMRYLSLNADAVYSFGGKISACLIGLGVQEDRIYLQSNGVEQEWINRELEPSGSMKKFVFVGRLEQRKGSDELNSVISGFPDKTDFSFHFIGEVQEEDKLVRENTHYHGVIRDPVKLRSLLDQFDCLILPSYSEGMPTVILESMARGLAILATNVGAVSRMIQGNGILLEKPDPNLLRKSIEDLQQSPPEKIREMKKKSLEIVQNQFTWSVIVDQKIQDFEKIVRRTSATRL